MNLSRHFTLAELMFSRTATAEGIDNTPTDAERANLEALCSSVLDPLRDAAGGPIKVTSGYRGPTLNKRIGGERASQHLEGRAADIQPPAAMSVLDLFKAVVRAALPFDQLIYEPKSATSKWVHVSHNAVTNRGQILVAHFLPTGKVERYEPVTAQQVLEMQEAVSRSARRLDALEYDEIDDEPAPQASTEAKPAKATSASTTAKKVTAGKTAAPKTPAKKASAKKASGKKAPGKKAPGKKASAKTAAAKKTTANKKPTPKKKAAPKPTKTTAKAKAKAKTSASGKPAKAAAKKRSGRT